MTTTGELHAIMEDLELVDVGDAASYLGEEAAAADDILGVDASALTYSLHRELDGCTSA